MLGRVKDYFIANTVKALQTPPWKAPLMSWAMVPVFAACALPMGVTDGILRFDPAMPEWPVFFAISVFVSPAFLEEFVFRGLLIPRDIVRRGRRTTWLAIGTSTAIYTLAHPLGALTTSPAARNFFLDPAFLAIVALLGVTCSYAYAVSKSLWVPVIIHWAVVLAWVLLFGGHELVTALEGHAWTFQ